MKLEWVDSPFETSAADPGHLKSICESCASFIITLEFRPTPQRQRDDAANKRQVARQKIYDGLLDRLGNSAV